MYLTYEEYRAMGGDVPEAAFGPLCASAGGRIDRLTHERVKGLEAVPEAVKMAVFALIHRAESEEGDGARMASFTNDGMSMTYAQETAQQRETALNSLVLDMLFGLKAADGKTPLTYAGVTV